ncbi:MAG: SPFH domain-containing protein [Phycisphaerae bacterium]|nr:SPFH domain-containing protein [Phycisphaerae bacterium]
MAQRPPRNPDRDPDDIDAMDDGSVLPPPDVEEPRREASARFVVQDVESKQAQMRAAMDPANQSLAEALRLSYRVLQVGILALVVTFLVSGFQTVREGFTGVKTIFGRIVGGDEAELSPGLQPFWPAPIGELIVFEQRKPIELLREFQPRQRPNETTRQDAVDQANSSELFAERDGWVLTSDGDVAHLSLNAEYYVTDAKAFLKAIDVAQVDKLVRKALMRGTVSAASQFTLQELVQSSSDPVTAEIKARSQDVLDDLQIGLTITSVTFTDRAPPRFVEKQFLEVQVARVNAQRTIEMAMQKVAGIRTGVAGGPAEGGIYDELINLIQDYDAALVRGEREIADGIMQKIGDRFERSDVGGEVASVIQQARASTESMLAQLKQDQSRLEGLAPAFKENSRQLVQQLLLETLAQVYGGAEVEILTPPTALSSVTLRVRSSQDIMQTRRNALLQRKKAANEAQSVGGPWFLRGNLMTLGQRSGSRLDKDATKGAGRDDIRTPAPGAAP